MIRLENVSIVAGQFRLQNISFAVRQSEYAVLMGPTGRGKTTLLEIISGLRKPASGNVYIRDVDVTTWLPASRGIGYVPQDLALFPNLNVRQHLEFALRLRAASSAEIRERTKELAELLGIAHLLDRRIRGLSGGEAQRVALGRAISFKPSVLLLDEPLSALDKDTRLEIYELLSTLKATTGVTTLHVTHNIEDAEALADRRLHLIDGQIVGT